jgi:hypothetical protein
VEFTPASDIYYVGVFLLSLTALFCFYNARIYFLSIYLIQRYNIEQKYPKLNRILKYNLKHNNMICYLIMQFLEVYLINY